MKKLTALTLKQSTSKGKWVYIPEIDKEVEIEVHDKNKSYDDLKKIYGDNFDKNLLTREECEKYCLFDVRNYEHQIIRGHYERELKESLNEVLRRKR
jgi:hypothetical protein